MIYRVLGREIDGVSFDAWLEVARAVTDALAYQERGTKLQQCDVTKEEFNL